MGFRCVADGWCFGWSGPVSRVGGARTARLSRRVGGFRKSLGCWDMGLGLGGWPGGVAESVEGCCELVRPGPVGVESEAPAAGGADENGGDVEDLITVGGWFGVGEGAGEAQGLGPAQ